MANPETRFQMTRGETLDMEFTAFVSGGDPDDLADRISLTGAALRFAMKLNAADTAYEVRINDVSDPTQVLLSGAQGPADPTRGQYRVILLPADTNDGVTPLPLGNHVFDTWVTLAGGEVHTVISLGEIGIGREVDDLMNP
jgi:hypothetical protein